MPDKWWFPEAKQCPGPDWKQGYTFVDGYTNNHLGKGACVHSLEGSYDAGIYVLESPKKVSWTFLIRKVGPPVQHYPANAITWHCGRYGDSQGEFAGNACLLGIEVEGDKDEPLTLSQIAWLINILQWYWRLNDLGEPSRPEAVQTQQVGGIPAIGDDELWEHNEIVPTDCPSGRIPWDIIIKGLIMPDKPTEWERYTKGLALELQFFTRVAGLSFDIGREGQMLDAVWRRSGGDSPLDHAVFKRVAGLCQQLRAAVNDLEARCTVGDRTS